MPSTEYPATRSASRRRRAIQRRITHTRHRLHTEADHRLRADLLDDLAALIDTSAERGTRTTAHETTDHAATASGHEADLLRMIAATERGQAVESALTVIAPDLWHLLTEESTPRRSAALTAQVAVITRTAPTSWTADGPLARADRHHRACLLARLGHAATQHISPAAGQILTDIGHSEYSVATAAHASTTTPDPNAPARSPRVRVLLAAAALLMLGAVLPAPTVPAIAGILTGLAVLTPFIDDVITLVNLRPDRRRQIGRRLGPGATPLAPTRSRGTWQFLPRTRRPRN